MEGVLEQYSIALLFFNMAVKNDNYPLMLI